ncbi:glutathione S-transferase family protein [Roseibium sp.]|uniref:glutathione S-transferase family protein n=1 Tax=Roseibium sp. TaxID=1936156 RepID=UPI003263BC33
MPDLELFIGNKNYSSWSFRPWIALTHKRIPFRENLVPFDFEAGNPDFAAFSPSRKVPVLKDGDLTVWDSLAILEYAAELFPETGLWPESGAARATARSVSAEMHSGFAALREACPMNMRRERTALAVDDAVKSDIARIVDIWSDCLNVSGGPFLFGEFTIADAMYAPIVSRFDSYRLSDDAVAGRYHETMIGTAAWTAWEAAAVREPWTIQSETV